MIVTQEAQDAFEFVIGFAVHGRHVRAQLSPMATREQLAIVRLVVLDLLDSYIDAKPPSQGQH